MSSIYYKNQKYTGPTLDLGSGSLTTDDKTIVGAINELDAEIEGLKANNSILLTKTDAVTMDASSAYRSGNIIKISVDITMASAYSAWVNVLAFNAGTLKLGGFFVLLSIDGTSAILGQVFDNDGALTLRLTGCQAKQYRGECVVIVGE